MSAAPPLARLVAWEAVTPVGESAAETALLLRAGVRNVSASHFVDGQGERIVTCRCPVLPPTLSGNPRLVALAALALQRLARKVTPAAPLTLLLALPERMAMADTGLDLTDEGNAFVADLRQQLPDGWSGTAVECFPFGRAGGALALRRAVSLLADGGLVIWGGVDSQHDWPVLHALEQADRLLTLENLDGLRPGEGAAFVALGTSDAEAEIAVLGLGLAREPHPVGADEPSVAAGMRSALDAAVAPLRRANQRSHAWWLDSTSESYATQELQNVITHMADVWGQRTELHMPMKELGDAGAAAMPLMAALCAEGWRTGHTLEPSAVLACASDRGARGAVLLAVPPRRDTE